MEAGSEAGLTIRCAGVSGAAGLMAVKNDCPANEKHSARHSGLRPGVHSASATGIVAWKQA